MSVWQRTARGALLSTLCVALAGCPLSGGRWDRYAGGGSFIGASPVASPDGRTIVFSSPETGHGDLYVYDLLSSSRTRLTDDANYEGDPRYSPDGSQIVFVREEDDEGRIWLMDADGSRATQVTSGPGYDCDPSFSPDGKRIVFSRYGAEASVPSDSAGSAEIFAIDVTGKNERRLTHDREANFEPSFSPDGESILYDVWASEVWIMETDGENPRRIATGASAAFSPDWKRIVAVTGEYGREISLFDADGSNLVAVIKSKSYLSSPSFLPDGQRILYLEQPDASGVGNVTILDLDIGSAEIVTQVVPGDR